MSRHVIRMGMTGLQHLDVGELVSKFLDVPAYDRHGAVETGVDQDLTVRGGDEVRSEALGADVIEIVSDAMRRERVVPIASSKTRDGRRDGNRESEQASDGIHECEVNVRGRDFNPSIVANDGRRRESSVARAQSRLHQLTPLRSQPETPR